MPVKVTISMPAGAAERLMADPEALKAALKEQGFDVIAIELVSQEPVSLPVGPAREPVIGPVTGSDPAFEQIVAEHEAAMQGSEQVPAA
jgi:hypothetical protein